MDTLSAEQRSYVMSRIRSKDTHPELLVRSLVHKMGYRFRLHRPELPGSPDLVFVAKRKVIFVHGCFWHSHGCARGGKGPKSKSEYWRNKLLKNEDRDRRNMQCLQSLGWSVLVVWECQLKDVEGLGRTIKKFLEE